MENQVVPSTNLTVPAKSKKNPYKVVSLFVIGLLLAVAGAGVYYYLTQKPGATETVSDTPPALKMSTLQGKSVETGYLVFSSDDESKNQTDTAYSSFPKGINLFYSDADIKVSEIIDKIKANNGQRVLIAYYDTGLKNFYTYPVGPYQGTVLMTEDTVIPRFQGFFIMSDRTLELLESGVKPSNEFAGSYDFSLSSDATGWMMAVVPESAKTAAGFNTFFKTDTGRIQKIYLQSEQNKFDKVENFNTVAVGNYSLAWLLVGPATQTAATQTDATPTATTQTTTTTTQTTTTTAPAVVCGDGTKADTEACDDGNTSASDGCSPTCTVEPDVCTNIEGGQYSLPSGYTQQGTLCVKCGDGNKEGTESCDDGNAAAGDGCTSSCTVEPDVCTNIEGGQYSLPSGYTQQGALCVKCGDGNKEGTEYCDDGNTAAGDGCSATCTIEIAPIRPIEMNFQPINFGNTTTTTTENTIVPKIKVAYLNKTGGGLLQDDIYTPKTPDVNDPVWCMGVEYIGNPNTWIKLNELKFSDKIKMVNDNGGADKWSDSAFRTRELVYFTNGNNIPVAILNYPWRTNLYRLTKDNQDAPVNFITKVTNHFIDGTNDSPIFFPANFIDSDKIKINAGQTGYFCLIHDSDQYFATHPNDPDWVEGGAVLEAVNFKDSLGNFFQGGSGRALEDEVGLTIFEGVDIDDTIEFTNLPPNELTTQLR